MNRQNQTSSPVVTKRLDVICLADVQEREISWLWKPYIPSGKITILEGDPESGKTFLSLEIAAHVTTGRTLPMYHGEPGRMSEARNVMFMTAEDDLADTILPRFRNAGGDPSKFFSIEGIIKSQNNTDVPLGITLSDIESLNEGMKQHHPAMLIVDPFQAFIGAKVDFHRSNEVRPVMQGIGKLAAEYGCAVVLIRHLAKAAYGNALYKGIGSIDIIAAARSVLRAGINPQVQAIGELSCVNPNSCAMYSAPEGNRFVIVHTKCNVAQKGTSIAYKIVDGKLSLDGAVSVTVDDLQRGTTALPARKSAVQFLNEQLASGQSKNSAGLFSAASRLGISESTLRRASNELNIKKAPSGFGKSWSWSLLPVEVECTPPVLDVPSADAGQLRS